MRDFVSRNVVLILKRYLYQKALKTYYFMLVETQQLC